MNKREIFLDTSFVVAIINNDDQFHKAALDLEKNLKTYVTIWITEAILIEIGNTFSKSNKSQVSDFIQYCYESPQIHVVNTDEGLLRQALDLFKYTTQRLEPHRLHLFCCDEKRRYRHCIFIRSSL